LARSELKSVYDENPEIVKKGFNHRWAVFKHAESGTHSALQDWHLSKLSPADIRKVRNYQPRIQEWNFRYVENNKLN
jgi:hypothetical protein